MLLQCANAILYTDGAPAYEKYLPPGVLEHHIVNRTKNEFVRPCKKVPVFVPGQEAEAQARMRSAKVACQTVDAAWHHISDRIPETLQGPTCQQKKEKLDIHIRAEQWSYMVSTKDAWAEFCAAARLHSAESDC